MIGVLVKGVCPGVEELFEELNRSGLKMLNLGDNMVDPSRMLELTSHNIRERVIEIAQSGSVRKILAVGNDDILCLAYSFCSVGLDVAYVPSADSSITSRGLGTRTIVNYLMRMLVLAKETQPRRTIVVVLPKFLDKVLMRSKFLLDMYTSESSIFLKLSMKGNMSVIHLEGFLNCLTLEEQDRMCYFKVARKLSQAFTQWSKVCHVFFCDDEPMPISRAYELLKKVKVT